MNSGQDVSVIVQGPVHGLPSDPPERRVTRQALESARAAWPKCELILSTWKGSNTSDLCFDQLIESDDPGGVSLNDQSLARTSNNLNRQIVSTRAGLIAATRSHAVKLRSDCLLIHPFDFARLFSPSNRSDHAQFQQRIATLTVYTRHPLRRPVLFHLSDLFHAGLLSDLQILWSAPLVAEPAFTRAIVPSHRPTPDAYPESDFRFRCAPEQYLAEQLTRRSFPWLHIRHPSDGSARELFLWLRVLASNFLLLTPAEAGVQLPARMHGHESHWDLFQVTDFAWLEQWSHPNVASTERLRTLARYYAVRSAFRLSKPRRAGLRRVIRRLTGADIPV